jgi:ligand-binding SRPBCC domain-containing protein
MRVYEIYQEQFVARPVEEVFGFFSDAHNLEQITPAWMNFHIVTPPPIELRAGATIEYRLRWRGISLRWVSEIPVWEPPRRFVDVQVRGPYAHWRHTHDFEPAEGGTLLRDRVEYALPLGPLGRLAHWLAVRRNLEAIFAYRAQRVAELLAAR